MCPIKTAVEIIPYFCIKVQGPLGGVGISYLALGIQLLLHRRGLAWKWIETFGGLASFNATLHLEFVQEK